jgi:hypothetical protein
MSDQQSRHRALPHWPRRMKAPLAADYVGESVSTFLDGVKHGKWPERRRDSLTRNVYWFIEDLDAALDRQKGGGDNADDGDDEWADCIGKT